MVEQKDKIMEDRLSDIQQIQNYYWYKSISICDKYQKGCS